MQKLIFWLLIASSGGGMVSKEYHNTEVAVCSDVSRNDITQYLGIHTMIPIRLQEFIKTISANNRRFELIENQKRSIKCPHLRGVVFQKYVQVFGFPDGRKPSDDVIVAFFDSDDRLVAIETLKMINKQ